MPRIWLGSAIRDIFKQAREVAELHGCLTSPRGDNFRFRLLQAMESPLSEADLGRLRDQAGINEYHRHLHMLLKFGLVRVQEVDYERKYIRTGLGEKAINALRQLERRISTEKARPIYLASLGCNSIRFFLRIYGDRSEAGWDELPISYTPAEMGRLSLFLPRVIESASAVDKLNKAELVVYGDDNYVHVHPVKARSFYQYLRDLYGIIQANRYHHA